jgi:hypothetical protein
MESSVDALLAAFVLKCSLDYPAGMVRTADQEAPSIEKGDYCS